ncbi:MAG: RNA methyltransferase [Bacteroidetes bacterium]|nr:RNA methyltransferase [Bacteroidota bacterium]
MSKNHKTSNANLNRISASEFKKSEKFNTIIVLDGVRSLHNVGSVFRTADAFLIEAIYLCGLTGTPPNKEIEKTALGATNSVEWVYFKKTEDAIISLKNKGYKIYAVEQAEQKTWLNNVNYNNENIALVFGNEVYGVEQPIINMCNEVIEIPQLGTKHSLNISVSVGVVLWQLLGKKINVE